ncbi:microfibril-associated glycoprotein 4-like [Amphiura filiformis]|uniref:microfibril-associated glycoprotein 4-like n=1 Tax=Amphiura filiformis TaxID=82378 RepID=UPI003B214E27
MATQCLDLLEDSYKLRCHPPPSGDSTQCEPILQTKSGYSFKSLEEDSNTLHGDSPPSAILLHIIRDCFDLVSNGNYPSGIYTITPSDGLSFQVYCDMSTENAGWTVFQRRFDGSVNFYRNWTDYENGFGGVGGEYWTGLRLIHLLTSGNPSILRVELEAFDGGKAWAEYQSFAVGDSSSNYVLTFGSYSGNASDSLANHNNRAFSTYDRDHDSRNDVNCAEYYRKGAWWYGNCGYANLNGQYLGPTGTDDYSAMAWHQWKSHQILEAFDGDKAYAEYPSFIVGDSSSNYVLTIGSYSGNASDSLGYHNNRAFSTYDRDHDSSSGNCAQLRQGAWWYGVCERSNLNGQYLGPTGTNDHSGMTWYYWKSSWQSHKTSVMKDRRVQ